MRIRGSWPLVAIALLAGCAQLPADRGYGEVARLADARGLAPHAPDGDTARIEARTVELTAQPLGREQAVSLALLRHPRMRQLYARLGIAEADVVEASRLPNPSFGYSTLDPRDAGSSLITRSFGLDFAALLLLPDRKRLAQADRRRVQYEVAADVLELAHQAERAWYADVGARQVAEMRHASARAAELSAQLAQRLREAGNLGALALALEQAAAQQAALEATRADVAAIETRAALALAIGLPTDGGWTTPARLKMPPQAALLGADLPDIALARRLDLLAAREALAVDTQAAASASRWRLLGDFELGYERENDTDGARLRGPAAVITIPLFDQGQAEVARARFQVEDAQAQLDAMDARVRNEVATAIERLEVRRAIALRYREAVLPLHEAVVARTQEQVNFMLKGTFELILSRREQYDAYRDFLVAVRDYWLARADLRAAIGGPLPDAGALPASLDDIEAPPMPAGPDAEPDPSPQDPPHQEHGDAP